jgi:hypothetical protein
MNTEEKKEYELPVGKNQLTDGSVLDDLVFTFPIFCHTLMQNIFSTYKFYGFMEYRAYLCSDQKTK